MLDRIHEVDKRMVSDADHVKSPALDYGKVLLIQL